MDKGSTLFPISGHTPVGIARLAEAAEPAGDGHLVEFRSMAARSILNRSESKRRLSLAYSINPYRGCEFGCRYCYARYTHEFLAPAPGDANSHREETGRRSPGSGMDLRQPDAFERVIFLKKNAAWLLEQELRKIDPVDEIALGTATDPYQPAERWAGITRSLLEVFAKRSGLRLGIVTKSTLIERDMDLLAEISRRNCLVLHVTITTPETGLARRLEPRAPRPDLRFATVKRLREKGLQAGILCSPLLPGITDGEAALDKMAGLAACAGASFFAASPLFLKSCSRPTFLSFIQEHFPALEAEYATRFADADFAARPYRQEIEARVRRVCRRYGLLPRSTDALLTRDAGKRAGRTAPEEAQQRLFA